mgnify:CR=1 FL=1
MHRLNQSDFNGRVNVCSWMLQSIHGRIVDSSLAVISDKILLSLSGGVDSQNSRYWEKENPHIMQQNPLQVGKVAWCAVCACRIIFFFSSLAQQTKSGPRPTEGQPPP